jgi:hypothetical protein
MNPNLSVNVTVDQIQQGCRLLRRFNADTDKLTEVSVISNTKDLPDSTASIRYEDLPLDRFIGEKVTDWDGHSPLTLYFNEDGHFDHYEKTGIATAGASAA